MSRHKNECVECFDPKTLDIIRCVCSLERLVDDVFKCLSCRPSTRRLQQILTCLVLEDVRRIENLLNNETFGLSEIKSEVIQIENTVQAINNILNTEMAFLSGGIQAVNNSINSSAFGLQRIENDIQTINNSVNSSTFGLRKIENEIQAVNNSINSSEFGLQEIRSEIQAVNNSINSSEFGLREIGSEIQAVNNSINSSAFGLQQLENEIQAVNDSVNNPVFGLQEIGKEIQAVNSSVNSSVFGLREIRNDMQDIISSLNSPLFGLQEIENQMRAVGNSVVGIYPQLTTGPVFINENARHLTVRVQNNTSTPRTVNVRVMRIDKQPFQEIFNKSLEIPALATNAFRYIGLDSADCCDSNSGEIEVILDNLTAGLYPTMAQFNEDDKIIASSIFRSADFIPRTENYV